MAIYLLYLIIPPVLTGCSSTPSSTGTTSECATMPRRSAAAPAGPSSGAVQASSSTASIRSRSAGGSICHSFVLLIVLPILFDKVPYGLDDLFLGDRLSVHRLLPALGGARARAGRDRQEVRRLHADPGDRRHRHRRVAADRHRAGAGPNVRHADGAHRSASSSSSSSAACR